MGIRETNHIGIEKDASNVLSKELKELLANYQIFYMNVRGFHWNIKGDNFFELHQQYALLYSDLSNKIDEIAERIITFGEVPPHSYQSYISLAEINPAENVEDGKSIAELIVKSLKKLLTKQRQIAYYAKKYDDDGTCDIITGYIKEQEKQVWMYNAFLKK